MRSSGGATVAPAKRTAQWRAEARAESHSVPVAVELRADRNAAQAYGVAREMERWLVHVDVADDLEGLRASVEADLIGPEGDGRSRDRVLRRRGSRHEQREEHDGGATGCASS